jgi:hypothetical protein
MKKVDSVPREPTTDSEETAGRAAIATSTAAGHIRFFWSTSTSPFFPQTRNR